MNNETNVTQADRDAANTAFDIAFRGDTDGIDEAMAELFTRHRTANSTVPDGLADKGPWEAGVADDGRVFLQSEDFTHDVRLYIDGDFRDQNQRWAYAQSILSALTHTKSEPASNAMREALEPFYCGSYEQPVADENGWTEFGLGWCRDRIVDWFGPSDFARVRKVINAAALSQSPDTVEQAVAAEQSAWDWLEQMVGSICDEHPSDIAYSADQMVDAFTAGVAIRASKDKTNG